MFIPCAAFCESVACGPPLLVQSPGAAAALARGVVCFSTATKGMVHVTLLLLLLGQTGVWRDHRKSLILEST